MTVSRETICVGYHGWNKRAFTPFLKEGDGAVRFTHSPEQALSRAERVGGRLAIRASGSYGALIQDAKNRGIPILQVEDGFLRSVGLGREWARPISLVLDRTGIHYDPSAPCDLESLIRDGEYGDAVLARAEALMVRIRTLGLSKYNVGEKRNIEDLRRLAGGRPIVLVPGQVENDASVLKGSPEIRRNADLLCAAKDSRPNAFIIYKPHPDVERGFRPGHVPEPVLKRAADLTVTELHASSALALADEVHTMTSLMGFEALLRGLSVTAYGGPFYAGWGLTQDRMTFPRRQVDISLTRLVAATLILYPDYRHPETGAPCTVEDALDLLADGTSADRPLDQLRTRMFRVLGRSLELGRMVRARRPMRTRSTR